MAILFVSGSRSVKKLPAEALKYLNAAVRQGVPIIVGDCHGADTLVQEYLRGYKDITVYHIRHWPRNNVANSPTRMIPGTRFTNKDVAMCRDCTSGLVVWDGKSSGSHANIERLEAAGKPCYIVVIPAAEVREVS